MKNLALFLLLLLLPMIWLSSCNNKSSETNYNPNVLSSKDYVRSDDAMMEIVNAFFKGIHDSLVSEYGYGYIDACDVIYHPGDNELLFSYGAVNRMCQDYKFRKGQFVASFTGPIFEANVTATLVTDSLLVDDLPVEATMEIKNLGLNADNLYEYSLKVTSSNIVLADTTKNKGINLTTDYLMVWAEGSSTPTIHEDDTYIITGTASGNSSDGYEFSTNILEPHYNYLDCWWISRGYNEINVPTAEYPTGDIDYITDDGCFNQFYFYFNNNQFYDMIK